MKYPNNIKGWLLPKEAEILSILCAGKNVLEVGTYEGLSSCCMIQTAKTFTSIDPHLYGTYQSAINNITKYASINNVPSELYNLPIEEFNTDKKYNFLFIDACHTYQGTLSQYKAAHKHLYFPAYAAFHDYQKLECYPEGWDYFPGVKQATYEIFMRNPDLIVDTLAIWRLI
jgi:hypothetical protein